MPNRISARQGSGETEEKVEKQRDIYRERRKGVKRDGETKRQKN